MLTIQINCVKNIMSKQGTRSSVIQESGIVVLKYWKLQDPGGGHQHSPRAVVVHLSVVRVEPPFLGVFGARHPSIPLFNGEGVDVDQIFKVICVADC